MFRPNKYSFRLHSTLQPKYECWRIHEIIDIILKPQLKGTYPEYIRLPTLLTWLIRVRAPVASWWASPFSWRSALQKSYKHKRKSKWTRWSFSIQNILLDEDLIKSTNVMFIWIKICRKCFNILDKPASCYHAANIATRRKLRKILLLRNCWKKFLGVVLLKSCNYGRICFYNLNAMVLNLEKRLCFND